MIFYPTVPFVPCSSHTTQAMSNVQPCKTESSFATGSFNFLLLFVIMPDCFTTVMLIQIKNTVFYAIQVSAAVSDVFLDVPLFACVAFKCVHVCACAKWIQLISHSLISASVSSWSQEDTAYMPELFSARQPVPMHSSLH